MVDVVIIGAGAAGIGAALTLQQHKVSVQLIEAKDRIGGRAHTDSSAFGYPVDLGCHWLHSPDQNPLRPFAESFGIRHSRDEQATRYSQNGRLLDAAETADCDTYIDACFDVVEKAGNAGRDVPVDSLFPVKGRWHALFESALVAKMCVPLPEISVTEFARYVWTGDWPVYGGLGTLIARLGQSLPIALGNPASKVTWGGKAGISVETPTGRIDARAAIITASPGVLVAEGIRFDPALPDWKRQAIADLPMGHCNKVILDFARNVFGPLQSVLLTPDRGAGEAVEFVLGEDNQNVAVCMFNGPFARDIAQAGAAAMRAYALERLGEVFGSDVGRHVTRQTLVADWDADVFTRGSFVAAKPGRANSRGDLQRPVEDRLFFAGEATSVEYAGDVHGAYLSGIDAAEAAITALRT